MKLNKGSLPWTTLQLRIAAAAAAVVTTTALLSALVLTFHSASPPGWLESSPELVMQVNACEQGVGRTQRERGKQHVVTAQLAHSRQPIRLAGR